MLFFFFFLSFYQNKPLWPNSTSRKILKSLKKFKTVKRIKTQTVLDETWRLLTSIRELLITIYNSKTIGILDWLSIIAQKCLYLTAYSYHYYLMWIWPPNYTAHMSILQHKPSQFQHVTKSPVSWSLSPVYKMFMTKRVLNTNLDTLRPRFYQAASTVARVSTMMPQIR